MKWTRPDVWKAFLKYSELSDDVATEMMTTCSMPVIDVDALKGANGVFRGEVNSDIVYLDKAVCERFERDYPLKAAKLLVESTLLHEMVHWGDWKDNKDQSGEEGKAFEKEAYGYDVNRYGLTGYSLGWSADAGVLYEERSRKAIGDFSLTERIQGYWNRQGIEIDLVAVDEDARRIRFGTCKRSASKLWADLEGIGAHVQRFLGEHRRFGEGWTVEKVAVAPVIDDDVRMGIEGRGFVVQDLRDLTAGL